jgi:HSP20 family molecular chaperone IbpA
LVLAVQDCGVMTALIDEINRLFDELVHDPWRRPQRPTSGPPSSQLGSTWEFAIPIHGVGRDDIAFSIENRQLTVTIHQRATAHVTGSGAAVTRAAEERFHQSFMLPEHTELASLEARFEGDVLRIRATLRARQP